MICNTPPIPVLDKTANHLVRYLEKGLTLRYNEWAKVNPQDALELGTTVVAGIRSYDANSVSDIEFPLLKVYRTSDAYVQGTNKRVSPMVAAYCLFLPQQDKLQPLLQWVSWHIRDLLLSPEIRKKVNVQYDDMMRAEYRVYPGTSVNAFLIFNFTITD